MASRKSPLQAEIQQSRPFRSLGHEAVLGILRTADVLRTRIASRIRSSGITHQQYNVLRILRGAGSEGLPTLSISERMIERAPGITRLIDRLVDRGWVCRERVPGDRRRVQCCITESGLALLAELDPVVEAYDSEILSVLQTEELETLIQLLDRIRSDLPPD